MTFIPLLLLLALQILAHAFIPRPHLVGGLNGQHHAMNKSHSRDGAFKISVQTKFMEGWTDLDTLEEVPTNRVIVSLFSGNSTESAEENVPLGHERLALRVSEGRLQVWTEEGGQIVKHTLSADNDTLFETNIAGRLTLVAPLESGPSVLWTMPKLLIRYLDAMDASEWILAPIHTDLLYQLQSIDSESLSKIIAGPNSLERAKLVRNVAAYLRSQDASIGALGSPSRLSKRNFISAHQVGTAEDDYKADTNSVATYLTTLEDLRDYRPASLRLSQRFPVREHIVLSRGTDFTPNLNRYLEDESASGPPDAIEWHPDRPHHLVYYHESDAGKRLLKRRASIYSYGRSLADAGRNVKVAGEVGLSTLGLILVFDSTNPITILGRLLKAVRMDWSAVLYTQQVIRHYALTQTPLMKAALEATEDTVAVRMSERYTDTLSTGPAFIFEKLFGNGNASSAAMQRMADQRIAKLGKFDDRQVAKMVRSPNVRVTHLHDLMLGNAHDANLVDERDSFSYLQKAKELKRDISTDFHEKVKSLGSAEKLKGELVELLHAFKRLDTASPLVFLTKIVEAFGSLSSKIYLFPYVPKLLDILTGFYSMRIKMPYVRRFYMRYVARGQHDMTLLDLYSLLTAVLAQFSYSLIVPNQQFFSASDAAVISSVSNPMTILFHWMNDERTRPLGLKVGSKEYDAVQYDRECRLDWMTRFGMLFSTKFTYSLGLIEQSLKSRKSSPSTIIAAQMVGQVKSMCWFISNTFMYPTDQVNTLDGEAIQQIFENPDPVWYGWWSIGYGIVLVKVLEPLWEVPYQLNHMNDLSDSSRVLDVGHSLGQAFDLYINLKTTLLSVYYTVVAMADMVRKLDVRNRGRLAVATANSMAWYYDCKGQVMPYVSMARQMLSISHGEASDNVQVSWISEDQKMLSYYTLRILLMMRFKIYGLSEFRSPSIDNATVYHSLTEL